VAIAGVSPTSQVRSAALVTETLRVLLVLEAIGLAALPLAVVALGRLTSTWAVAFAKPLGVMLLAWLVYAGGRAGIPNGTGLVAGAAVLLVLAGLATWPLARRIGIDRRRVLGVESLTIGAFCACALFNAFQPAVWGTEKPMDMSIVNATIVSPSYPPHDPWLAGADMNYYYLGHLAMGLFIRLTDIEPTRGYNLALAVVFAMAVGAAFGLAAGIAGGRRPRLAGAAAVILLLLAGTVHSGLLVLRHHGPLEQFNWFAASRVIPDTINEFPFFSFLLGDLHAHVIALPLMLMALALVVQVAVHGPPRGIVRRPLETVATGFVLFVLYGVNSWSWPVATGLFLAGLAVWMRDPASRGRRGTAGVHAAAVVVVGVLLILPFLLEFETIARGPGILHRREDLSDFLVHHAGIFGTLLWALLVLYVRRLGDARHPERVIVWGTAAALVAIFLLAEVDLAGAGIVAGLLAVAVGALLSRRIRGSERAVWLLVAGGLICILLPELIYVRDEFDKGTFLRMNTIFKMQYSAYALLAVAAGVLVGHGARRLPRPAGAVWWLGLIVLTALGLTYTVGGSYARKAGFAGPVTLDGRGWLAATAPGDIAAIDWLRANAPGDAVVLEAVGDDYSAFGHARISTYTGLQTVLGWAGHELQYRHPVDNRREDVKAIYTGTDPAAVKALLDRYAVGYVVVGPLERADYGDARTVGSLGRKVLDREGTVVYELPSAPGRGPAEPPPPVLDRR
jgi:YYY domain-containing protein